MADPSPRGAAVAEPVPDQSADWLPSIKIVDAVNKTPEIRDVVKNANEYLGNVANILSHEATNDEKEVIPQGAVWEYRRDLSGNGTGSDDRNFQQLGSRLFHDLADLTYLSKGQAVQSLYVAVKVNIYAANEMSDKQRELAVTQYDDRIKKIREAAKNDIINHVRSFNAQLDQWNTAASGEPLHTYDSEHKFVLRFAIPDGIDRLVKFVHDRVISADRQMDNVGCQIRCQRPRPKPTAKKPVNKPKPAAPSAPVKQPAAVPPAPPAPPPPQPPPPMVIHYTIPAPVYQVPPVQLVQCWPSVVPVVPPIVGFVPFIPFFGLIQRQCFPVPWCGTVVRSYWAPWAVSPWSRTWARSVWAPELGWFRPPAFPAWAPQRIWSGYGTLFSRGFEFNPYRAVAAFSWAGPWRRR